ncbi:MAG: NADH-quinone oxidoreductase subunit H [Verrucomicrobia bacterium]|nr:NADH-quinone oxidoreductase subunit H [Verrucomicrobiota bacterium]NDD56402.1 NADH-quinone oxidoreductase subunit H [Verrucomicrobiota bacterium]NDD81241.1 NADH-quinone oxidoreductase subunit H [Verrucomicrobiota bacterium]
MFLSGADVVFLLASLIKAVAVAVTVLVLVPGSVTAERRLSAWIQDRLGPNRVGIPFTNIRLFGLGQALADAAKFLLKEQFVPASVNKFYFNLAPILAMVPALVTVAVIPFSPGFDLRPIASWIAPHLGWDTSTVEAFQISGVIANLDIGLLFVFAVISLSVYGIVLAGWASNSKYPFLGGIRSSAQIISYEIAMGASVVPVFLVTGSLNLGKIVDYQIQHGWLAFPSLSGGIWGILLGLCLAFSFLVFLIASFAETNRLPFDLPEAETELVGGYHTEYSGMRFALFFLGEYAAMVSASAIMVTVFLGGWSLPLPWFNGQTMPEAVFGFALPGWLAGQAMPWWFGFLSVGVFLAKILFFIALFIVIRWTLPRFKYDQLMSLGWKVFIPMAFVNIFIVAALVLLRGPSV